MEATVTASEMYIPLIGLTFREKFEHSERREAWSRPGRGEHPARRRKLSPRKSTTTREIVLTNISRPTISFYNILVYITACKVSGYKLEKEISIQSETVSLRYYF